MHIFIELLGVAGIIVGIINSVLAVVDDEYITFIEWIMMIIFIILTLLS